MRQDCDGQFTLKADCSTFCGVDPCAPLEGQEVHNLVTCGTASCPSPTVFECSGGSCGCTGGAKTQLIPTPAGSTSVNECSATLKPAQALPTSAKIKTSAAGSSSTTSYCNATYVYTGTSAQPYDQPTDLASLSFGGVTATTENGQCPDGTVKGQMNGQWVCVADSNAGGGSGCPTGQIRNNQGECVPFSEAGTGGTGDGTGGTGGGDGSGGGGGTCTITGQTQVNGVCTCPTGQTVQNNQCTAITNGGGGSTGSGTSSDNCTNAPTCSGDPLQCASLEQIWKSACQQTKALTEVKSEQLQQANDQITSATNDLKTKQDDATNKAQGFFADFQSKATASTSSQCMPDMTLAIMGKQLIIPFSKACDFFRFLRVLVIFSAYMLAARIVFGGLT